VRELPGEGERRRAAVRREVLDAAAEEAGRGKGRGGVAEGLRRGSRSALHAEREGGRADERERTHDADRAREDPVHGGRRVALVDPGVLTHLWKVRGACES